MNPPAYFSRVFHLIEHGALHLAGDVDKCLVGTDGDDVVILQADVAAELTVEQEVVDVDAGDELTATVDLDVAQCTDVVGTTSHVEGIVNGGEGRHGVSTGNFDFADDADSDGTRLAEGQVNLGTLIAWAEDTAQPGLGLTDGESAKLDDTNAVDGDGAVGRDGFCDALLRGSPDVDVDGIARAEAVVLRGGEIH